MKFVLLLLMLFTSCQSLAHTLLFPQTLEIANQTRTFRYGNDVRDLSISNSYGSVDIVGSSTAREISVSVTADSANGKALFRQEIVGTELQLTAVEPFSKNPEQGPKLNIKLVVPFNQMDLISVISDSGDITVRGESTAPVTAHLAQEIILDTDRSYIKFNQVTAGKGAWIFNRDGNIFSLNFRGLMHAQSDGAGNMDLFSSEGEIQARLAKGQFYLKTPRGGNVQVVSEGGTVAIIEGTVDNLDIKAQAGSVEIKDVVGKQMNLASVNGDIRVERSAGNVIARSRSGFIEVMRHLRGLVEAVSSFGTSTMTDNSAGVEEVRIFPAGSAAGRLRNYLTNGVESRSCRGIFSI